MSIFKSYDIRGIYPVEIDEDIVFRTGRAFAEMLRHENLGKSLKVVVGNDMRLSSDSLKKHLISGIISQGVDVVDIGLVSTPTFYYAVAFFNYDGGIQISASHNPKEYNGMKLVRKGAIPIGEFSGMKDLEKNVLENKFPTSLEVGRVEKRTDVLDREIESYVREFNFDEIKKFKIVVDPANAMAALYMEKLFQKLPCKLVKMNFALDGTFPNHEADPLKEENLEDVKKAVLREKADFGIAFDGDGDRIFFIDDLGKTIEPSIIRGVLSKIYLKEFPGSKICYDARPGRVTKDMIEEYEGIPIMTRIGHTLIKDVAMKEGAVFAGESSGHFFVKKEYGMFEMPCIVLLKLLEEFSKSSGKVSDYIAPLKKYHHSGEINFRVKDKDILLKKIKEEFSDAENIYYLDGISIEYDDWWMNLRPSNTESKTGQGSLVRLNLEAKTNEKMRKMLEKVLSLIES
ncbi:MAG: phosphomannomutase/phosphoglucomutase [Candidatus Aenigmarchaeota archaeon]|nr:phosphomannomutase/phosphoglucomutase [Candidatus Aenigmarchaeota archaeon]